MSEKRFTYDKPLVAFSKGGINDNVTGETYEFTMDTVLDLLNELYEENNKLRQMIKENVFQLYNEGSLADLEFKAIAYDDIIKIKVSDESEPKVIVYCKQGKKGSIRSYCQMFIPFGIAYEIKEVIDDE